MSNQRLVLGLGNFARDRRNALAAIAREAACQFESCDEPSKVGNANPHAVLIDAAETDIEAAAIALRQDSRLARVPVIALYPEIGDLAFASAFNCGADDAVCFDRSRALTGRLRGLPRETTEVAPGNGPGRALIADSDPTRRVIFGRLLRNAGYQVQFAVTAEDAAEFAKSKDLELVVLSTELNDAPRQMIEAARAHGSTAIFVVNSAPRTLRSCRNLLVGLDSVAASDSYAPAENVLFLANDMKNGGARRDQRATTRLLYGTTVAFRGAGRYEDDYGFTYNVSEGGLYIRTLAVPEDDSVWLELCPPRAERRIRLVAQVQWRRRFGYSENARVPPGFGVKVTDGARSDLEAWKVGCEAISDTLG